MVQSNDDKVIWVKIRNAWNDEHEQREVYNRESGVALEQWQSIDI